MGFRYAVIGAGMQGTAAAFDLARFGRADEVRILDIDHRRARDAASRVNALLGREIAKSGIVNASDKTSASQVLEGMSACLSAVPYFLNVSLTRAAIDARVHFNDLGGNTDVVLKQLDMDDAARAAGVSIVPDCGVAPGMANTLAVHGMQALDESRHVRIRCGGLPKNPNLPLGYKRLFSLEGLTDQYFGKALILRGGRVAEIDTFEEVESLELPQPIGPVEAFVTSGGASTCPYTFVGKLESYDYKTIRYPGHYEKMKLFKDMGFIGENVIEIAGHPVVPRQFFHVLMERVWDHPEEPDLLVLRVDVEGVKDNRRVRYRSLVLDASDRETGFTATERTTAFAASIVTALMAQGRTPPGAVPLETSVDPGDFVRELGKRDISLETSLTDVG